jgi:transcriptional/translational regulatory protein YebC/TACO1
LTKAGLTPDDAEVTERADNLTAVDLENGERLLKLVDMLEDLDDVQEVFHNGDIPLELLESDED